MIELATVMRVTSLLVPPCTKDDAFTKHGMIGKIFFGKKYLVFKLQKWFLLELGFSWIDLKMEELLSHLEPLSNGKK